MSRLRHQTRAIAGLCLLLAIVHTWPLITAPGTLTRNDNADAELNEWILAWVAHQLPRAPSRLFDGNIFYPERDSLAFSEPLIVPALMGAPLHWLGASPVLVFNVVLILGFALTAWAGYALAYEWTGDRAAGMLAGSVFAFNTHTLTRLAHVQGIHAWGLPLTLLAADRILVHQRWRDAVWLAVWMTAMAYTSGYLIVFGAIMIAVVLVTRVADWWPRAGRVVTLYAVATVLSGLAVLPVYLPYRRVARELGMLRPIEAVTEFSATWTGYLAAAGTIHFSTWSARFWDNPVDAFFPGFLVIVLAAAALYWGLRPARSGSAEAPSTQEIRLRRRRIVMLVAIGTVGVLLSLGTRTPVYGWLYPRLPADAGPARCRQVWQSLPAGDGGTGGLRPRRALSATARAAGGAPRRRARCRRERRVAARAVSLHALRGHPTDLLAARERARPRRAGGSPVLPASGRLRERRLRAQFHRALAQTDEWI